MAEELLPAASTDAVPHVTPPPAASSAPVTGDAATISPTPAETPSPVVEAAPVAAEVAPSPAVTALGAEPTKKDSPAVVPPEIKADAPAETPKEEGKPSDEPATLPSYEAFTFPEGVTFDEAKLGDFTKQLGEFQNLTKASQPEVQKFGQKLVDQHVAALQETTNRITEYYTNAWEKQKSDWKTSIEKDPVIGGNRLNTVMTEIANTIATTSTPEEHTAFRKYMQESGIGNNPDLARPVYNLVKEISRLKAKYESETGVKPLLATKPQPASSDKAYQNRYKKQ